jgi:hypothetical protein
VDSGAAGPREGNRLDVVVDAIAELDAAGLITRINKRVVCASRAAIHADRLDEA